MLGLDNGTEQRVELESEKWKPLILRHCTEDMPTHYAPCLSKVIPALEYGEEIVYPDFEAALPGFFNIEDALLWIDSNYGTDIQGQTGSNKRVMVDERQGRLVFAGERGQNLAFRNVKYEEKLMPESWLGDSSHCLGHMTAFPYWYTAAEARAAPGNQSKDGEGKGQEAAAEQPQPQLEDQVVVDEAAVYVTPDSDRYQHWLDHTSKVLMQSAHLITNETVIFPGGNLLRKQPIVQTMWNWLPHINKSRINTAKTGTAFARRLFTACRVPYVHPYLFFRLQELVLGPESPRVPLSERKVVAWYSRSVNDKNRANVGRQIRNEEEAKAVIVRLLQERGLGERLEVHPPLEPPKDPLQYIQYLNRNVAAMIGPHGGGLCNFKWLASDTLVLELMPRKWISTALYEEAIGHGLNYWVDVRDSLTDSHDMDASVPNIVALLKAELGKKPKRGPILSYHYDWPAALREAYAKDSQRQAYYSSLDDKCCLKAIRQPGNEGVHILKV